VHIVIVNVKPLLRIGATAAAKGSMEYLPFRWRSFGFSNHHNDFGISSTFLKKTSD